MWLKVQHWEWHVWARLLAGLGLLDQGKLHILSFPPEVQSALILACIATIFAPRPSKPEP